MISIQNWLAGVPVLWIMVGGGLSARACHGQVTRTSSLPEARLKAAVQGYLQDPPPFPAFEPTSYLFAFVDLAGSREREVVVYLTGRAWCGSGGCHMLVLTQEGSSYKVVTKIPAVKLPIKVLEAKSHGWHDLSVFIQGGGIMRGYEEVVRFDGKNYTKETSDAGDDEQRPVRRLKGKTVLSYQDRALPLFP